MAFPSVSNREVQVPISPLPHKNYFKKNGNHHTETLLDNREIKNLSYFLTYSLQSSERVKLYLTFLLPNTFYARHVQL